MKALILAEKPSVGKEIGRVLNCRSRGKAFMEGNSHIVTWAMGHLVELVEPHYYDAKYKSWNLDDLPIIPDKMKLRVMRKTSHQYKSVSSLISRKDVNEIIIATDAGREGELVARWILKLSGNRKPIKRLWISSQTDKAIKDGMNNLKPGSEYMGLFRAAESRAYADWIVGLNITRALTCKHDSQLNAGRVQTPTLAMMVNRELERKNFVSKKYWKLFADLNGLRFHRVNSKNSANSFDWENLNAVKNQCKESGEFKITEFSQKKVRKQPPLAYDLTELQRDANKLFGFSAKKTLSCAQTLYERMKLITYPRTDSRCITDDMVGTLKERLSALSGYSRTSSAAKKLLTNGYEKRKSFINNAKVSDHHALLPTETKPHFSSNDNDERKIYELIAFRFLAVLSEDAVVSKISASAECSGERFTFSDQIVMERTWMDLPHQDSSSVSVKRVDLKQGQIIKAARIDTSEHETEAPPRYTEATLLTAMEFCSKFVKDPKLKEKLKDTGLGTPATRADIIEKLIGNHYVERDGKQLVPTGKASEFIRIAPQELVSPDLTAVWENQLELIAKRKMDSRKFLDEIKQKTVEILNSVKKSDVKFVPDNLSKQKCPVCGKNLMFVQKRNKKVLICPDGRCDYNGEKQQEGMRSGRKSKKQFKQDKFLISKYGKQNQQTETLGDLFGDLFDE